VETCLPCHGDDGRGTPLEGAPAGTRRAPALEGSPRVVAHRDHVLKVLLHGLSGPLDGRSYTVVMIPMRVQSDEWLADVASYIRNAFGNSAPFITSAHAAAVRQATASRTTPWTEAELVRTVPRALEPTATWAATASHNANQASRVLGASLPSGSWSSGAPQVAGMWFQVEVPVAARLLEVQVDTTTVGGGARGAGGRGRGGGGPPALPDAGFPRRYRIEVSDDGAAWRPAAEGEGAALTTTATFVPVRTRFVRITQTAPVDNAPAWIIQRIRLYEAP
jgi:hypothetical protein